jgi:hypothetical protein
MMSAAAANFLGMSGRPPTPLAKRFWDKVKAGSGCWEWQGALQPNGYGKIRGDDSHDYRHVGAHRVSWELHYGPIDVGRLVCHTCDNPRCVRPEHLFLGSPQDNQRDCVAKGRHNPRPLRIHATRENIDEVQRAYAAGERQYLIAERLGVPRPFVCDVLKGRVKGPADDER